ncbi:MAG: alpha/beta hydrolase [Hyphomicrobium aestuarii]|nr:alpha/beta hydrolase [Hyphomicrobium aestuarii]
MGTQRMVTIVIAGILVLAVGLAAWLYTPDRPLAALEAKYLAAPSDYVTVAGLKLHVRDTGLPVRDAGPRDLGPKSGPGDGKTIILIHGLGASLHTWEPWAQSFAAQSYRVIRYDLPGHGLTGPDPTGLYTEERAIEVLLALMDAANVTRATLIGNSIGGRLAWRFAAAHPARVDKLVLISPDGFASPGYDYGKAASVPSIMALMTVALPKSMLRDNIAIAYADPARLTAGTLDRYYDLMLAPGVRSAMLARMEQTILVPPEPLLATITAPTLLLWGEKDGMIPITNASDYLKAMPNAQLAQLPALGHVPHEEAPTEALAPVLAFLGR